MPGPAPKPAHLRQRTNKKAGATVLSLVPKSGVKVPEIPNPDGRVWHPLTLKAWKNAWKSPMASQWLESDFDGLARLAILWDEFNKTGNLDAIKEIKNAVEGATVTVVTHDSFNISEEVRIKTQFDVLDNVLLGSTPSRSTDARP